MVAMLALALLVLTVFWPATRHGFVHWDDEAYVFGNQVVQQGLTLEGLGWAFTTGVTANWHPLTWVSHMIDVQLFGMEPGRHHLSSVILHLIATLLLFRFLLAGTGILWRSAAVAALFAVHPLHVESVAWVAERKDVLSGALFMLVLLSYLSYARRPSAGRMSAVVIVYALGLMAKPMLVTLPLILILLDYWPLGRIAPGALRGAVARLLLEKVPCLVLAVAMSCVALLLQIRGSAVSGLEILSLDRRLANAVAATVKYLWKTVAPTQLIFVYPYPLQAPPVLVTAGATLLVSGMTLLAAMTYKRHPEFLVGWCWYLATLLPVIGIVQIGPQAMADRYTYLPLLGIFIAAVWLVSAPAVGRLWRLALVTLTLVLVTGLAFAARTQVGFWRDDLSLFGHAVEVDPGNWIAQQNLGTTLAVQGRVNDAIAHFTAAVRANPKYAKGWSNLGLASLHQGRLSDAESEVRTALSLKWDNAAAHDTLGAVLLRQGRLRESLDEFELASSLDARNAQILNNLGTVWFELGNLDRAEEYYRAALSRKSDYTSPRNGLEAVRQRRIAKP